MSILLDARSDADRRASVQRRRFCSSMICCPFLSC